MPAPCDGASPAGRGILGEPPEKGNPKTPEMPMKTGWAEGEPRLVGRLRERLSEFFQRVATFGIELRRRV
jgi:hypothetical protein